jgi:hypothetical protein
VTVHDVLVRLRAGEHLTSVATAAGLSLEMLAAIVAAPLARTILEGPRE